MKLTTLDHHPELYGPLIKLIEKGFHYSPDESFSVDFFPLVQQENWQHCHLLIDDNNKIAAHIGACKRYLSTHHPVTLLGGIVVEEAHQGKGLMSQILKAVIDKYLPDTTFFILWSDLDDLYLKYNFHQAGICKQLGEEKLISLPSYSETSFQDITPLEWDTLKTLYKDDICDRFTSFSRSEKEWDTLRGIKSTKLFISRDHNNQIDSYFFYGKGGDLNDVIHEFAAKPHTRVKRVKELSLFRLWLPSHPNPSKSLYLGLFRYGSQMRIKDFLEDISRGDITLTAMTSHEIAFTIKDKSYQISTSDFWPLLFGPNTAKEFQNYVKPLYFSGLDTI